MGKTRIERDSLGEMMVPADAYYGCQTQRAVENYPISGLRHDEMFIRAFVIIKKAAARANREAKAIQQEVADAIDQACDEVLAGQLRDEFVVDVFQMGAGTSFHMNVNEVLANRAEEILGGDLGQYKKVHPNNDINFGQSTNDTFPTAMRLSILMSARKGLLDEIEALAEAFEQKGQEFDLILKSARTHLQDAVPIRLGQEFAAYGAAMRKCREFLEIGLDSCKALGIGGSAAGTGLNTAQGYRERLVELLSGWCEIEDLRPSNDMREAMQSQRPVAEVSAALRNLSLETGRICNDLRLLSSGPTTGLAEIRLPAVAPGSSIMPGKVNPSMLEMMNMICFQVQGCDATVAAAVGAGQLELNVMMPVMAFNTLFAMKILRSGLRQLRTRCIEGIQADKERCRYYGELSLGLATALNTVIGYENAAKVAKRAQAEKRTVTEIVQEEGILSEQELTKVLDAKSMTEPGIPGSNS